MFNEFLIWFKFFLKWQYLDCSRKYYDIIDLTTAASNTKCNTKSCFVLTSFLGYLYFPLPGPLLGPWPWPWPLALTPTLYLPALAPNLYLPTLASNLCLRALASTLCLPQICIYLLYSVWVCIYRSCLPSLYLLVLASISTHTGC